MEALSGIIRTLGIDSTLFVQFPIFLVILLGLWAIAFKPYFAALTEREKLTTGSKNEAESLRSDALALEAQLAAAARDLNSQVRAAFDQERVTAQTEHDRILGLAKDKARTVVERAKTQAQEQYNKAREELLKDAPALGQRISERLISGELQ
jgi:F0F1-type ATP synthase membrane subunit b/b'